MRDRASFTAAWVAGWRSLGVVLPEQARLADDPYGARFAPAAAAILRLPPSARVGLRRGALYMQVRTRVLDAVLLEFARDGGTQVVILGAGFDCRALRFARELAQATVYEVDHPATQARKRAVLHGDIGARTDYVAWDFESRDVRELPKELASRGHDARKATLTLWEGVTPYLTVNAIDASVRAVHDYSSRGSRLAFTYFDRTALERPRLRERLVRRFVASVGEPFRFGWRREDVPSWFEQRGFALVRDASMPELAAELLPQRFELQRRTASRRIAIVSRM